jgi:hypothetical protein
MSAPSSRVFICCGQASEIEDAIRVRELLESLGFEPYIAAQVHSPRALRENIFNQLRNTEYFLFIDFRREQIAQEKDLDVYRGSLFSNQELAIASFLDLDILPFQENGVKPLDGMLGHLQLNAIHFSDRSALPEIIRENISKAGWQNDWRNQLVLEQADPPFDRVIQDTGQPGFFFHIQVRNRHKRTTARNCYGFLRSVRDAITNEPVLFETVEFKWAGYKEPNAIISPGAYRKLDALWFYAGDPSRPRFRAFTDWHQCVPSLQYPGSWYLEYEVLSENIPGSTITIRLDLGPLAGNVRFGKASLNLAQIINSG